MKNMTYRGEPARLLKKCVKLLTAIVARDARASSPTPTAAVSTRYLMLDANPPGTGPYFTAAQQLLANCRTLLAMQSPPSPGPKTA